MKMYFYLFPLDRGRNRGSETRNCTYAEPHGMHINRARNFYPDQDDLTTMAFPTVPVLLPIIELSKNNQIPSRQSVAFT